MEYSEEPITVCRKSGGVVSGSTELTTTDYKGIYDALH